MMTQYHLLNPYPVRRFLSSLTDQLKVFTLPFAFLLAFTGCATQDSVFVESANQDTRVRIVAIHHTTGDFQSSFNVLTEPSGNPVSSHYLIPEPGDPSYSEKDLKLYSLVKEEGRAWHAGSSYWAGKTSLNDMSIGIELVNQTYCRKSSEIIPPERVDQESARLCFYPDFADSQLEILIKLLEGITERHTEVKPTHIVGHADIAPQRKIDPGPRFPWQRLYKLGYGAWYDDDTVYKYWEQFRQELPSVLTLQTALHTYGYDIELTGENDKQSQNVVRAFQMHFLPWQVSGEFTVETVAVLYALLEKYYPKKLELLQSTVHTAAGSSG
jgi:N-acetyl-anhydromuramyl-L-alanine amidase AmpD